MSTPFPLEEQTEQQQPAAWDPWKSPTAPSAFAGMGFNDETMHIGPFYRMEQAGLQPVAKGVAVLNGIWKSELGAVADVGEKYQIPGAGLARAASEDFGTTERDARDAVRQFTPNPQTTGSATNLLTNLYSGATELLGGSLLGGPLGGAAAVGGIEGGSKTQESREQGIDKATALELGGSTGILSGAGAMLPGGFGASLATRILTGAASNTAQGLASRYADHQTLEANGYHEMAAQQKVWDSKQVLIDAALGTAFGGIHHLFSEKEEAALKTPGAEDAALTANLAQSDTRSAAGVPVDPAAANAHAMAQEKAQTDLLHGDPVDVSGTGIEDAQFLERPQPNRNPVSNILLNAFKESGIMEEEASLRDLENELAARRGEPQQPPIERPERVPDDNYADFEHQESENLETPEAEREYEQHLQSESSAEGPGETTGDEATTRGAPAVSAQEGGEIGPTETSEAGSGSRRLAEQALSEKPDMQIAGDEQPKSARDALQSADKEVATSEREIPSALQAPADCFSRRGVA